MVVNVYLVPIDSLVFKQVDAYSITVEDLIRRGILAWHPEHHLKMVPGLKGAQIGLQRGRSIGDLRSLLEKDLGAGGLGKLFQVFRMRAAIFDLQFTDLPPGALRQSLDLFSRPRKRHAGPIAQTNMGSGRGGRGD